MICRLRISTVQQKGICPNPLHRRAELGVGVCVGGDDLSCHSINDWSRQTCDLRLVDAHEAVQSYTTRAHIRSLKRRVASEFILHTGIELLDIRCAVITVQIVPSQHDARLNYGIQTLRNHGGKWIRKVLPKRYRRRVKRRPNDSPSEAKEGRPRVENAITAADYEVAGA